jgi:predicted nucleic acid-binding protein
VIVVDASVIIELLLRTEAAEMMEDRLFSQVQSLCAPHLLDLEVAQVLRRYAAAGEITGERGLEALEDLGNLPIHRYPHDFLLERIWELRHNITAYDAAYISLAESLPAPLITRDARLSTAPGHHALIELI